MTDREIFSAVAKKLSEKGFESAEREAKELVFWVTGKRCLLDRDVSSEDADKIDEACRRRCQNEPLQYILGEWEFCGLTFSVGRGVLIPRQDTETVVETALKLLKTKTSKKVFDLCAGSGCIGISLEKLGQAEVILFEKSKQALRFLKKNVELNRANAKIVEYDVLNGAEYVEKADMIVSNPPYIRTDVLKTLQLEVQHEPIMALDGGEDGLLFYKAILSRWKKSLKKNGYMVFEIGFDQAEAVKELCQSEGFCDVTVVKDFCGHDRAVFGILG